MSKAAENVKSEEVLLLPVTECHKSPSQPRRRGGDKVDDDFVASVKKRVQQPIVVRARKAGGWEIVFGHRRHKACEVGGVETIPAIVRSMTDEEVFEAQLIENVHREDMHPLDEADGFKRMMEKNGRTAQQIAERIGRPLSYVAQRLKLVDLSKEARAALDKEKISLGIAMMLARIPSTLQGEALKTLWEGIEYREAKRQIEGRFLLRLDHAPFKLDDAKLVEKAGACTACPKRTGQQRELFPDAGKADMCVDPVCYRGKLDAVWQIRRKGAAAGGVAVLEGEAARRAIAGYGGTGYKKLDDEMWTGSGHKKVRSLFGRDLPPITLARDENSGSIYELVRDSDVKKKLPKDRSVGGDSYREQNRRQQQRDRQRGVAIDLAIAGAIAGLSKLAGGQLVRALTHALVMRTWNDGQTAVIRRRGLKVKLGAEATLLAHLRTLSKPVDVSALGLELALRCVAPGRYNPAGPAWSTTLRAAGVNFAALERRVAAEAKARKKSKFAQPKKRAA